VSPGQNIHQPLDTGISTVTRRFWWPVYAEFRDNGHTQKDSLDLCYQVVGREPDLITQGLRDPKHEGHLRSWVEDQTREILKVPTPSGSRAEAIVAWAGKTEAREPLRWATRASTPNTPAALHQRWAHVLLETALERVLSHPSNSIDAMEVEDLVKHLDQPLPSGPGDDFTAWIRTPQILSLKQRFWGELRQAVNETITNPRSLERELLDLFPLR
jgi:hypothetical protein